MKRRKWNAKTNATIVLERFKGSWRHTSETIAKQNEFVVQRIHSRKAEYPFWVYRRIWVHLRFVDGL